MSYVVYLADLVLTQKFNLSFIRLIKDPLNNRAIFLFLFLLSGFTQAQELLGCEDEPCPISYTASFFVKYAPVTALDMVRNLPGFELDDGDTGSRGFGAAAGNLLVNGERVTAKSDTPSAILARIPAADVEEIVVIRGQTGGLDLVGQTVVANVIRKGEKATGTWNLFASIYAPDDQIQPYLESTYADSIAGIEYTLGLSAGKYQVLSESHEFLLNDQGSVLQEREERESFQGEDLLLNLNTSTDTSIGKFNFNVAYSYSDENGGETSIRQPDDDIAFSLFQGGPERQDSFEGSFDYERSIGTFWGMKIIGIKTREDTTSEEFLVVGPPFESGIVETITSNDTVNIETIARLELDFKGYEGHLIGMSVEGAINELDSSFGLLELVDDQLVPIDVPGAITKVEERRVDFNVSDSFVWGSVAVDALLGAEKSTIKQTGGFNEDRSFFFWKPSLTLTYAPETYTQITGRLFRSIGQLDFFDFVSQVDLGDVELALGNPNLVPETSITADVKMEKRFSEVDSVSLTLFHDEIDNVIDLLPLEDILEIPGNIGSGSRTGLSTEITLSLDSVGLKNGRMDLSADWQTSEVTDPLSGERRALSDERRWQSEATLRQDLVDKSIAWSITAYAFDDLPLFGLDEVDIEERFYDIDAFIETRAINGIRLRFGVVNALRHGEGRDRSVFHGSRNSTSIAFKEIRDRRNSREWFIDVSGAF